MRRADGGAVEAGGGTLARSRFMARLGLLSSGFFGLAVVAQWIASFVLGPCMGL